MMETMAGCWDKDNFILAIIGVFFLPLDILYAI